MRAERSFVGQQGELALPGEQLEKAAGGQAGVVLVTGEPGIGKTRLLREVAARAAQARATVLWGDASEAAGMPPYLPFLKALGSHIRAAPGDELRAQAGPGAGILSTLLPEPAERPGDLPRGYPLPAGLTHREAEVLRLVAAGLSNRDIAAQFALSESTVAKHLSAIFSKTATDNRMAVAGFAHRHELAGVGKVYPDSGPMSTWQRPHPTGSTCR